MDEQFIRNRITQLRIEQGISERQMSLDLGHSESYIHSISSGRSNPSASEFLFICTYLHITPEAFFHTDGDIPLVRRQAIEKILKLPDDGDVELILKLIERIKGK